MYIRQKKTANSHRSCTDDAKKWSNDNEMGFVPLCKQTTPAANDMQRHAPIIIIAMCNETQQQKKRTISHFATSKQLGEFHHRGSQTVLNNQCSVLSRIISANEMPSF